MSEARELNSACASQCNHTVLSTVNQQGRRFSKVAVAREAEEGPGRALKVEGDVGVQPHCTAATGGYRSRPSSR